MNNSNFQAKVCQQYGIEEDKFVSFVLRRTLFPRVHLVRPIIQFFYPHYLFNERRLVEKAGKAVSLREIQAEVDFYQHKYVVNFFWKETFRFRLSGMRLMSLANEVLIARTTMPQNPVATQESAKQ